MRGTPVARRPAEAAAGDAPTVTRHAVEHREVIVVPASSGTPLQADSGEGVSAPSNPVPNLPKPTIARAQPSSAAVESSRHPTGERVDSSGSGGDVLMEVAQVVEPSTKSHAPEDKREKEKEKKGQTARIPAWTGILVLCHRAVRSSHPRPSHCVGTGVPWVSLPGRTWVPLIPRQNGIGDKAPTLCSVCACVASSWHAHSTIWNCGVANEGADGSHLLSNGLNGQLSRVGPIRRH